MKGKSPERIFALILKKTALSLSFAALIPALTACYGAPAGESRNLFSMDTVMTMTAYGDNAASALTQAEQKIKQLNGLFSVTDENSEIYRINESEQPINVSADTKNAVIRALQANELTGGAFDITLRPVSKLWGFTSSSAHVPEKEQITAALKKTGKDLISISENQISCGGELDLGGIAKGYAAACGREIFASNGIEHAVVSLGGNVMLCGTKPDGQPWNVGIIHPSEQDMLLGTLKASDTAVVTSGMYERNFEQDGKIYHHIIDPETGYPADSGIISATVITKDDTLADALSTALFVMGPQRAYELWQKQDGFEMILVTDSTVMVTEGIFSDFELEDNSFTLEKIEK